MDREEEKERGAAGAEEKFRRRGKTTPLCRLMQPQRALHTVSARGYSEKGPLVAPTWGQGSRRQAGSMTLWSEFEFCLSNKMTEYLVVPSQMTWWGTSRWLQTLKVLEESYSCRRWATGQEHLPPRARALPSLVCTAKSKSGWKAGGCTHSGKDKDGNSQCGEEEWVWEEKSKLKILLSVLALHLQEITTQLLSETFSWEWPETAFSYMEWLNMSSKWKGCTSTL